MPLSERIQTFVGLGQKLTEISQPDYQGELLTYILQAKASNGWFTDESIKTALSGIALWLTEDKLKAWLGNYQIVDQIDSKNIGLVLAGNIPLVGFHDILSALILGHSVTIKLSARDQQLYYLVKRILEGLDPDMANKIAFTEGNINHTDAIIATGSDNSARYFEFYFAHRPHIIRKNRNSLAILSGDESADEMAALAHDIFTYFGLGCRNVSMLLLPKGYKFDALFGCFESYNRYMEHNKYANNYDYQRAVLSLNKTPFYDTGFALYREYDALASPISVIHYMYYESKDEVIAYVNAQQQKIQCIISKTKWPFKTYEPGTAQQPALSDYADNVDTVEFLLNLN